MYLQCLRVFTAVWRQQQRYLQTWKQLVLENPRCKSLCDSSKCVCTLATGKHFEAKCEVPSTRSHKHTGHVRGLCGLFAGSCEQCRHRVLPQPQFKASALLPAFTDVPITDYGHFFHKVKYWKFHYMCANANWSIRDRRDSLDRVRERRRKWVQYLCLLEPVTVWSKWTPRGLRCRVNDGSIDLCCSFTALSCQFSTLATLALERHQYRHWVKESTGPAQRRKEMKNKRNKVNSKYKIKNKALKIKAFPLWILTVK